MASSEECQQRKYFRTRWITMEKLENNYKSKMQGAVHELP